MNTRAEQIATDIENDSTEDRSQIRPEVSWSEVDREVQEAIDDHIAESVAKKLEADGYGDAASYVRNAAETGFFMSDLEMDPLTLLMAGIYDDDDNN